LLEVRAVSAVDPTAITDHDAARAGFGDRHRLLAELGLTESLEVGYGLSPRGRALLDRRDRD
jgi:hypothetical protein